MVNYANAKICKLVSNHTTEVYYGSTCCSLANRKCEHISHYKSYLNGRRAYTHSYKLLALGDIQIILVEAYPCNNKDELRARERYWIENNPCVNRYVPGRMRDEWV